ncbi:MAG: hypothetical protein FJX73_10365 [Armatimonadetes bacterium]|nr:hypothetical protein [Armatimonadota bacterium]
MDAGSGSPNTRVIQPPSGKGVCFLRTEGAAWYVAHLKPRQETRVLSHLRLRAEGIEHYSPRIETVRRRWGRRLAMVEPMFPNYMFLRMSLTPQLWDAVRWTPGVRRILGEGDRPTPVPDQVVEAIHERADPMGFVRVGATWTPGQRVRVLYGPLSDLEGIFERPTSREGRVRILLHILGHDTPVEVGELDLETL